MPNVQPLSPNAMFADVKPMSPGIRVFHFFVKEKPRLNSFTTDSQNKAQSVPNTPTYSEHNQVD